MEPKAMASIGFCPLAKPGGMNRQLPG